MYRKELIESLVAFLSRHDGIADKASLAEQVRREFHLKKDRSVFYGDGFAIRFCQAASARFSNTVLSLSALRRHDGNPFFVCLVTPEKNLPLLANTTFLRKISHSSQELRRDNIKGSFNGGDIVRSFEGVANAPENFEFLFSSHENYTFEENLARLVEATNHISPAGGKFLPTERQTACIRDSVGRAVSFLASHEYGILSGDLDRRAEQAAPEIAMAAFIDNVNLRGRIIECLIASEGDLRDTLARCLKERSPLPKMFTADKLGDYGREFDRYLTETDIKTKILFLSSNPKGYNIDKLLAFLAEERSVYLVYVVAIDGEGRVRTRLCSLYNRQLLSGTRIIRHWAGRNSRGVTQYDGKSLEELVFHFDAGIDIAAAQDFVEEMLNA